jgi:hypothetical protein
MTKICPQCDPLNQTLISTIDVLNPTLPNIGENYCVKCGTKLIDPETDILLNCPSCGTKRREKNSLSFQIGEIVTSNPNFTFSMNDKLVEYCGNCGYHFVDDY